MIKVHRLEENLLVHRFISTQIESIQIGRKYRKRMGNQMGVGRQVQRIRARRSENPHLACSLISVADAHRLPQHPISRKGKRVTRPIIVKLTSYSDKNLIMRSLKNLKEYNEGIKTGLGGNTDYVYDI